MAKDEIEVKVSVEQLLEEMANTLFSNLKIYVEDKFKTLFIPLVDLEDTKMNVATLSTILASKGLFTKEEFSECFRDIRKSFGLVNLDGTMEGKIIINKYNFSGDKKWKNIFGRL